MFLVIIPLVWLSLSILGHFLARRLTKLLHDLTGIGEHHFQFAADGQELPSLLDACQGLFAFAFLEQRPDVVHRRVLPQGDSQNDDCQERAYRHRATRLDVDGQMRHKWLFIGDEIAGFELFHDARRMRAFYDLAQAGVA